MVKLLKYCLSLLAIISLICSCDNMSNETYHKLSEAERKTISLEYTQLAQKLEKGSPDNMKLLEKAIRINPDNDLAWRELSIPYLYRGMIKEWSDCINEAVRINPQSWQCRRGYDKLYYLRDYIGALYDLDVMDTLTPNVVDYVSSTSVDYLRGLCYLGLKDFENSKKYFNKYIEYEKKEVGEKYVDEDVFLYLGIIANYENDFDLALKHLDRAEKFEVSVAEVDYHKGIAFLNKGEYELAKKTLMVARKKYEEEKFLQSYFYEPFERIYISDIITLEAQLQNIS